MFDQLSDWGGLTVCVDFGAFAPEADVTDHGDCLAKGFVDDPRPIRNGCIARMHHVVRLSPLVWADPSRRGRGQAIGFHIVERDVIARGDARFEQLHGTSCLGDGLAADAYLNVLGCAAIIAPVVWVAWMAEDLLVLFEPGVESLEFERDEF